MTETRKANLPYKAFSGAPTPQGGGLPTKAPIKSIKSLLRVVWCVLLSVLEAFKPRFCLLPVLPVKIAIRRAKSANPRFSHV